MLGGGGLIFRVETASKQAWPGPNQRRRAGCMGDAGRRAVGRTAGGCLHNVKGNAWLAKHGPTPGTGGQLCAAAGRGGGLTRRALAGAAGPGERSPRGAPAPPVPGPPRVPPVLQPLEQLAPEQGHEEAEAEPRLRGGGRQGGIGRRKGGGRCPAALPSTHTIAYRPPRGGVTFHVQNTSWTRFNNQSPTS